MTKKRIESKNTTLKLDNKVIAHAEIVEIENEEELIM